MTTKLQDPRRRGTIRGMPSASPTVEPLVNTHFRIPERQKEDLRRLSYRMRVPESQLVREALEAHLPSLEERARTRVNGDA